MTTTVRHLLEAIEQYKVSPDARFVIVGDGDKYTEFDFNAVSPLCEFQIVIHGDPNKQETINQIEAANTALGKENERLKGVFDAIKKNLSVL